MGLVFTLIIASGAFGLSFFSYGVVLIPALLVLFLFGIPLGIAATGMVLRRIELGRSILGTLRGRTVSRQTKSADTV